MNLPSIDTNATASLLLETWRSRNVLAELPASIRPVSLSQGYDAQDQLFKAVGSERGGWKLGVGSRAAMDTAGLSRPLIGQLDRVRCHESGVHLAWPGPSPLTIECEIAFVIDRDLPPLLGRTIQAEDIRSTLLTFEIVRSRFINRKTVGWPSFVADNVGFEALVLGPSACSGLSQLILDKLVETTVVSVDGVERSRALRGDLATDPVMALQSLYAHAAERGITIRAGEVISTGALSEPFDLLEKGHVIQAHYLDRELSFSL